MNQHQYSIFTNCMKRAMKCTTPIRRSLLKTISMANGTSSPFKINLVRLQALILVPIFISLSLNVLGQSPSWQWIKSGGADFSLNISQLNLRTKQIGTDGQGNVYGIASVSGTGIALDTLTPVNGYGYDDFVVFSLSCNGDVRWMKTFGSLVDDIPGGIIVDKDGGVYVSGIVIISAYGDAHIADSVIPANNQYLKSFFIAKLDSMGMVKYINFPGAPVSVDVWPIRLEADAQGNPVVLSWFLDSTTWNGHHVDSRGYYLVKFDKSNGALTDIVELDFKFSHNFGPNYESLFFGIDNQNKTIISTGMHDTTYIGNDTIIADLVNYDSLKTILCSFDSLGNHLWHTIVLWKPGIENHQMIFGKPLIIGDNIFVYGQTRSDSASKFLGMSVHNPVAQYNYIITNLVACFDRNDGHFKTMINIKNRKTPIEDVLGKINNKIIISGTNTLVVLNQNDTIKPYNKTNQNLYYPYYAILDTGLTHFENSGATKTVNTNITLRASYLHVDHNGNIYLGGGLSGPVMNSYGDTTYPVTAQENFCIAKIAFTNDSCGCHSPVPYLNLVNFDNNTLTLNGGASFSPDSLYLFWGDGQSSIYSQPGQNISHTYTTPGPWNVCLKAYDYCDITDTCLLNLFSGIFNPNNSTVLSFSAFPNPFNNSFKVQFLENIYHAQIELYDVMGKLMFSTSFSGTLLEINSSTLAKGVYFLKVSTHNGAVKVEKLVKQ